MALYIVIGLTMLAPSFLIAQNSVWAQGGLFSYECQPDSSILFRYQGQPWHMVPAHAIVGPLTRAIAAHEHQIIIMEEDVSLWALYTNELQIHRNANPDGTKLIIPSDSCGPIVSVIPPSSVSGSALALVEAQAGGQATAFSYVAPDGSLFTFAHVEGPGFALAQAQSYGLVPDTGTRIHVVQPGENLFRIGLHYGIPVARLAEINGIVNVNLIYAGQILYLGN
jgi:hypothetical protein